jgi:hypothetical protein
MPPPPKTYVNEKKLPSKYVLTSLKDGQWEPMQQDEMQKFIESFPQFAQFFGGSEDGNENLDKMEIPDMPDSVPVYDSWEKAAKRIINNIWKHNSAYIFHEPVDPVKLNVPDYYDIIKNPMDFATIK